MRQVWGGGAGEKKRLQYFEFGLQYLIQPLGVNPTYSTFKSEEEKMLKLNQIFCVIDKDEKMEISV